MNEGKLKVGVFDSGIGGLNIVAAIKSALPDYEIIFRQDEQHFPYGTRSVGEIARFVEPILLDMVNEGCSVIVIACNTVSTTLISRMRQLISVPLIGIQPMLEDAIHTTETGKIAICATPTVYTSPEYEKLKRAHGEGVRIFEMECRDWPYMAGHDIVDDQKVGRRVEEMVEYGVDTIVLAATHYAWIENKIDYVAALHGVTVILPTAVTIEWLKVVIKDLEFKAEQQAL